MTKAHIALAPIVAIALIAGGAITGYATLAAAQTQDSSSTNTQSTQTRQGPLGMRPQVHGTITAINGTTITVADNMDGSIYTVEAGSAKILKGGDGTGPATVTVADLAVGDFLGARGTLTGTSLAATEIMVGKFGMGGPHGGKRPGVMGTVSAVSGSTYTVVSPNGSTYTVEAGNATVSRMVAGSVSDVHVGDRIGVRGSVNGTTVTAENIMDSLPEAPVQHAQQ